MLIFRWRNLTTRLFVIIISSVAATVLVWASARNLHRGMQQKQADETRADSLEKLEGRRQKYATLRSVHIAADARIDVYGTDPRSGLGSYEYWAEGDRYRIQCHTDSSLRFIEDDDFAYDGQRFYFLDHASGILSYKQQDPPKTPAALPNPLFLPVDFLSNHGDDCQFCFPRLKDLKVPDTRWVKRAEGSLLKSQVKDAKSGSVLTDLEIPGGIIERRKFKVRVRMAENLGSSVPRIIGIDRVGLDGKPLTSISFDNFVPSALGDFPRTIYIQAFDDNSNPKMRMVYTIRTLEVDQPIDNSTFAIGFDKAERVWDDDARRLVKDKPHKP